MCGRYSQTRNTSSVAERFHLKKTPPTLTARYNIAPGQEVPIVVRSEERSLELFRWGLIPAWANDPGIGNRMINARAETLTEKQSFRRPFRKNRCLVIADGFYEWQKPSEGRIKIPTRIVLKSRGLFAFAGLWDRWENPQGRPVRSFTIITTEANECLRPIHDRMPVILKPEQEELWLDPQAEEKELESILTPYPDAEMETYPVSRIVNSPRNDTQECIVPA